MINRFHEVGQKSGCGDAIASPSATVVTFSIMPTAEATSVGRWSQVQGLVPSSAVCTAILTAQDGRGMQT